MDVVVGEFWRKIFVLILFAIVTPQTITRLKSGGDGISGGALLILTFVLAVVYSSGFFAHWKNNKKLSNDR